MNEELYQAKERVRRQIMEGYCPTTEIPPQTTRAERRRKAATELEAARTELEREIHDLTSEAWQALPPGIKAAYSVLSVKKQNLKAVDQ